MRALKGEGFDVVVSLLMQDEAEHFGLAREGDLSRMQGLKFLSFPIPDLAVPDSSGAAREFIGTVHRALTAGKKIAIHCRQGIGRSGLVASSLLVMSGVDPEAAFRRVSVARGLSVPETHEQRDWVVRLSREFAEPAVRR